ncbi:MAG: serine hydrolase [Candidatus Aminicenantes bacterium]|nr:serine hydrolase [Candidatus Aminicenantes bacterium]
MNILFCIIRVMPVSATSITAQRISKYCRKASIILLSIICSFYFLSCSTTDTTGWVYRQPEQVNDGWETASLGSVGLDPTRLISLMNDLNSIENHLIHGIIIAKNNRLVFEVYFDGLTHPTWGETPVTFDRNRLHVLSSVAKSITATLVGIAIEKGFILSDDEKVFDFYPELADLNIGQKQDITLSHLLTMSSGLGWDERSYPLTDSRNDLTRFIDIALNSNDDLARFILEMEMTESPGEVFNYSGGNYNLLGDIIHRASGMLLDEFANYYLFEPLGIQESWWWLIRPDFVYASGDLALRLRDLAKIGQLFLQNGFWNGEQIIPEEWITLSSTPVFLFPFYDSSVAYGHRGYSFGWWPSLESYGEGAFAASGWGGQTLSILPEHDMVIVITGGSYWDAPYLTYHQIIDQYILPSIAVYILPSIQ